MQTRFTHSQCNAVVYKKLLVLSKSNTVLKFFLSLLSVSKVSGMKKLFSANVCIAFGQPPAQELTQNVTLRWSVAMIGDWIFVKRTVAWIPPYYSYFIMADWSCSSKVPFLLGYSRRGGLLKKRALFRGFHFTGGELRSQFPPSLPSAPCPAVCDRLLWAQGLLPAWAVLTARSQRHCSQHGTAERNWIFFQN